MKARLVLKIKSILKGENDFECLSSLDLWAIGQSTFSELNNELGKESAAGIFWLATQLLIAEKDNFGEYPALEEVKAFSYSGDFDPEFTPSEAAEEFIKAQEEVAA
jgi:hypothetical protein